MGQNQCAAARRWFCPRFLQVVSVSNTSRICFVRTPSRPQQSWIAAVSVLATLRNSRASYKKANTF